MKLFLNTQSLLNGETEKYKTVTWLEYIMKNIRYEKQKIESIFQKTLRYVYTMEKIPYILKSTKKHSFFLEEEKKKKRDITFF